MRSILLASCISAPLFAGTYEVPVAGVPAELRTFSLAELSTTLDESGNVTQIEYDLPQDLVGGETIHLNLQLDSVERFDMLMFSDSQAQAACLRRDQGLMCMVKYDSSIVGNLEENRRYLQNKYQDDPTLEARLQVMEMFGHEAIGIVSTAPSLPVKE